MQKTAIVSNPLYGGKRDDSVDNHYEDDHCMAVCCSLSFLCCLWIF